MEEEEIYFYLNPLDYHTINDNCPHMGENPDKLLSVKGDQIEVQPLWRMEQLAKYYGVDIYNYEDQTSWEYYEEVLWQIDSEEGRAKFREENLHLDTFDDYFEELAHVAAEIGAERAELKCLIKSLMFKYRFTRINDITEFPHEVFAKLYNRLVSSNDMEQIRVAERLTRYHIQQLKEYTRRNLYDKKMRASWAE